MPLVNEWDCLSNWCIYFFHVTGFLLYPMKTMFFTLLLLRFLMACWEMFAVFFEIFLIADCISGVLSQYHFAWQGLRAWFLRFTVIWKLIRITELGSSFVLAHFWLVFPFCTPLEIPENLWFSAVFREYKMGTLARNELSNIESSFYIIYRTKKIYRIFYFKLRK